MVKRKNTPTYLATIDRTRFIVNNNTVLFKADGQHRGKTDVPLKFTPNIHGCYSKAKKQTHHCGIQKKKSDTLYSNSCIRLLSFELNHLNSKFH